MLERTEEELGRKRERTHKRRSLSLLAPRTEGCNTTEKNEY